MLLSCAGIFVIFFQISYTIGVDEYDLLVLTTYEEGTDSFGRFMRSARIYDLNVKVLKESEVSECDNEGAKAEGHCKKSEKREMTRGKILERELETFKTQEKKIVMFLDSSDAIFTAGSEDIISNFLALNTRILLVTSEGHIVVPKSMQRHSEAIIPSLYNKAFIGYATDVYRLIMEAKKEDPELSGQNFLGKYTSDNPSKAHGIRADDIRKVFQTFYRRKDLPPQKLELRFDHGYAYVANLIHRTRPSVIIGDHNHRTELNLLGDYIAKANLGGEECLECQENNVDLSGIEEKDLPTVLIGVFVEKPTPFFDEFLLNLLNLNYPKYRMYLFIHMRHEYNEKKMKEYIDEYGKEYGSVTYITKTDNVTEEDARNKAVDNCVKKKCDYYFIVYSTAHLSNKNALRLLIQQNRTIVAPHLGKKFKSSVTNFQRVVRNDGTEIEVFDTKDIKKSEHRGLWNVGCVTDCFLINGSFLLSPNFPYFKRNTERLNETFCHYLRYQGVFMYLSNRYDFGRLVTLDNFNTSHKHNELYEIINNREVWEQRYIVPNYRDSLNKDYVPLQPCPDVYWFPLVTARFCKEMIEVLEDHGTWYDGNTHYDDRIDGGYDKYPAMEIDLDMVDYKKQWIRLLKKYVIPLQEKVYIRYVSDADADSTFAIKYTPDGISDLKPHEDSSAFSVNLALNTPGVDYEGGGVEFERYNCSVTNSKLGWFLIHPGHVTHSHRGLPTTKGTRYVLISFVDP